MTDIAAIEARDLALGVVYLDDEGDGYGGSPYVPLVALRAAEAREARLREALEWALRQLRGSTGYRHPPECSPSECVCGWRSAVDVADAALASTEEPR